MKKTILPFMIFMSATIIYPQKPCKGLATVTYAGQTYNTVQIGSQCWLRENLNVGTMIDSTKDQTNNSIIEKYCYGDNPNNCATYGGLYQWAEAVQYQNGATNNTSPNPAFIGNVQGICPNGWHIPSGAEFQTLSTTVNSDGNTLKAVGQGLIDQYGDGRGTNSSGFSALLAGSINYYGRNFNDLGYDTYFWSSTEGYISSAYYVYLKYDISDILLSYANYNGCGFSVRCLNDNTFTGVKKDNEKGLSKDFSIFQNYPNPFNPITTINYFIPKSGFVSIKVYDILGKEVATLVNQNKPIGNYSVQFNASKLSSGMYFYKMQAGDFSETKKILLLK